MNIDMCPLERLQSSTSSPEERVNTPVIIGGRYAISIPLCQADPNIDTLFRPFKINTRQLTRNDIERGLQTHDQQQHQNLYFSLQMWFQYAKKDG